MFSIAATAAVGSSSTCVAVSVGVSAGGTGVSAGMEPVCDPAVSVPDISCVGVGVAFATTAGSELELDDCSDWPGPLCTTAGARLSRAGSTFGSLSEEAGVITKFWSRGKFSLSCRKVGIPRAMSTMASTPTNSAGTPKVSIRDGAACRLRPQLGQITWSDVACFRQRRHRIRVTRGTRRVPHSAQMVWLGRTTL